jgi:hypothetical protein
VPRHQKGTWSIKIKKQTWPLVRMAPFPGKTICSLGATLPTLRTGEVEQEGPRPVAHTCYPSYLAAGEWVGRLPLEVGLEEKLVMPPISTNRAWWCISVNTSCAEGRDQEDWIMRPAQAKNSWGPSSQLIAGCGGLSSQLCGEAQTGLRSRLALITKVKGTGCVAQVVEHLTSKCKAQDD